MRLSVVSTRSTILTFHAEITITFDMSKGIPITSNLWMKTEIMDKYSDGMKLCPDDIAEANQSLVVPFDFFSPLMSTCLIGHHTELVYSTCGETVHL